MTHEEFVRRRNNIATSSGTPKQIDEAIKALDKKYESSKSIYLAKLQMEECAPDYSDIGGSDA